MCVLIRSLSHKITLLQFQTGCVEAFAKIRMEILQLCVLYYSAVL